MSHFRPLTAVVRTPFLRGLIRLLDRPATAAFGRRLPCLSSRCRPCRRTFAFAFFLPDTVAFIVSKNLSEGMCGSLLSARREAQFAYDNGEDRCEPHSAREWRAPIQFISFAKGIPARPAGPLRVSIGVACWFEVSNPPVPRLFEGYRGWPERSDWWYPSEHAPANFG